MNDDTPIVTYSHIPDFFGIPDSDETPEQLLERAKAYHEESIQSYRSHIENYPEQADYWRECLKSHEEKIAHLQIETLGAFRKRQRDAYIGKPVKEITDGEWWHAFEVLPPCGLIMTSRFTEFYVSEAFTATFHSGYLKDNKTGKCYTAMIDTLDASTKLCVRMGLAKEVAA